LYCSYPFDRNRLENVDVTFPNPYRETQIPTVPSLDWTRLGVIPARSSKKAQSVLERVGETAHMIERIVKGERKWLQ
jgi:hypothetical protein